MNIKNFSLNFDKIRNLSKKIKTLRDNKRILLKTNIIGSSFAFLFAFFSLFPHVDLGMRFFASTYMTLIFALPVFHISAFAFLKLKNKNISSSRIKEDLNLVYVNKKEREEILNLYNDLSDKEKAVFDNIEDFIKEDRDNYWKNIPEIKFETIIGRILFNIVDESIIKLSNEDLLNKELEAYIIKQKTDTRGNNLILLYLMEKIGNLSKENFKNNKKEMIELIRKNLNVKDQEFVIKLMTDKTKKYYEEDSVEEKIKNNLKEMEEMELNYFKMEGIKIKNKKKMVVKEI